MTRQVLVLAAPVLVEQALLYLVGLSDTILAGRYLTEEHLAAITNASYLIWFLNSLMTVVSVGATALVARLTGARGPGGGGPDHAAGGDAGGDPRRRGVRRRRVRRALPRPGAPPDRGRPATMRRCSSAGSSSRSRWAP